MKKLLFLLMLSVGVSAQTFFSTPFAHTYSIVAVDTVTGEIGAAVQSHWFSVGSIVIWAEAGVGAVATQSFVNPSFGPRGLSLLKSGMTSQQAVNSLLETDDGRDVRQLAIIDARGNAATHTGKGCIPDAGHITRKNYSIQANMMLNNRVWPAMEKAFLDAKGPLAERLVAALEAAQAQGGDIRGKQSAALLVVRGKSTGNIWEDRLVDLRVEDHAEPVQEIKRLLRMHRAYDHMNAGDLAIEQDDEAGALREYGAAMDMFPDNLEMKYWTAVSLVNMNRMSEALPMFKDVFSKDKNWRLLTSRLQPKGLLKVSPQQLREILNQ
ncbi:MAG: DUF1028 domain-containing protein [Calditrichia bacterium]|nr:DUF1028 domain-containing protein [Calditrichota bacterium]MCB0269299.1 DUF1028 domain-containing protein [Calditrichota bacterium]MCB9068074.1 DUF1028 domain-containing protein [Calditrichia bacterium]